jgi:hypothetical protein
MKVALWSLSAAALLALGALVWLGVLPLPKAAQLSQSPVSTSRSNKAPSSNRELVLQALRGSPDAASELIRINDVCMGHAGSDEKHEVCSQEVKRWTEIGLQNGSPMAAQMKVNELLQSQGCMDIYRAEYWLTRYRRSGAGNELMWKSDASAIERKKRSCSW